MGALLLLVGLAHADVLTPDGGRGGPPLPPDVPVEPVEVTPAEATPCDEGLDSAILTLRLTGDRAAYECLAADDDAQGALIRAMAEEGARNPERVSRGLALWRLHRLDQEVPPEEARAYLAVDRRLLADGIRAWRGRESPSPEHVLVFEQLDWYKPTPQYVEARLTEMDKANLAVINDPPKPAPPPEPEGAAAAMPGEIPPPQPAASGGCGCAVGGGAGGWMGLLALALVGRRRER